MYEEDYQDSVMLDDLLDDARYAEAEEFLSEWAAQYPQDVQWVSIGAGRTMTWSSVCRR